jgi:protein involved in polysaccharide export with SLBB domain
MDLPVGPDYVVGPGDSLVVNLWGGISQRLQLAVSRDGRITLPEVGPVLVSGKTLGEVQQSVQQVLRTQLQNVSASVSLGRLRSVRVYIVGDVAKPGAYDISSLSTPLNALFMAGGPTPAGSLRILRHFRGKQLVQEVDVYDLLLNGVRSNLQPLENGDTVQVPPLGPEVTVEGMVRRPAVYELHGEKTLADVFELAGGILPTAALGHIEVQRLVVHEKRTMVSLSISDAQNSSSLVRQLQSVDVQDGDRVRLFPIASFNQNAVYLEGHVLRPGRYSYRKGMKLTDLVSSFSDLLPEPAGQYAEIIRLNAPDYRPSVESFSLTAAMASPDAAPLLQPLDTVRIFSRFDFENPPTVAIWGEVRSPGVYRASGLIHVSDALHLAGGLSPDAGTETAQVFRYLPDGNLKIFSVNLQQALEGATAENIVLQSRDWMLIHKSASRVDPSSVSIRGEVAKPGRYLLTTNMHVGDLIRMAGGLKRSADTRSAELTRYLSEDQSKVVSERQEIRLEATLAGNASENVPLRNGDLLTIKELSGWQDVGASVAIQGEVVHPGNYGIHDGERLSSVLLRAGGFRASGYPYGAILQRAAVREMEEKERTNLIQRVRGMQSELKLAPKVDAQQDAAKEAAYQQWQNTLENLANTPATGRVTIRISDDFKRWRNTSADLVLRAGDVLLIPKKPDIVTVGGQVYNPTAVTYRPGKTAGWYLEQGGGPTNLANKKAIFVVRADGTVVGTAGGYGLWAGNATGTVMQPGDAVFVPEKVLGGPKNWATLFQAAQLATSIGSTIFFATRL